MGILSLFVDEFALWHEQRLEIRGEICEENLVFVLEKFYCFVQVFEHVHGDLRNGCFFSIKPKEFPIVCVKIYLVFQKSRNFIQKLLFLKGVEVVFFRCVIQGCLDFLFESFA